MSQLDIHFDPLYFDPLAFHLHRFQKIIRTTCQLFGYQSHHLKEYWYTNPQQALKDLNFFFPSESLNATFCCPGFDVDVYTVRLTLWSLPSDPFSLIVTLVPVEIHLVPFFFLVPPLCGGELKFVISSPISLVLGFRVLRPGLIVLLIDLHYMCLYFSKLFRMSKTSQLHF